MTKRYELSDSEWEKIEHLFAKSRTGRPRKWSNHVMFNAIFGFHKVEQDGKIFLVTIHHTRVYTVVFLNGVMMEL